MPTRRVALGDVYLPTAGLAFGASLLAAVVSEHLLELDEDQQELVPKLLRDARKGLTVPRIAMRYRLQTDTHGLDRSRHRIVDETFGGDRRRVILELDKHSRPDPQLIGAIMAIATMPPGAREIGLRAIENPCHFRDIHATILHQLGLDQNRLTYPHLGREERLTFVEGNLIQQII